MSVAADIATRALCHHCAKFVVPTASGECPNCPRTVLVVPEAPK